MTEANRLKRYDIHTVEHRVIVVHRRFYKRISATQFQHLSSDAKHSQRYIQRTGYRFPTPREMDALRANGKV